MKSSLPLARAFCAVLTAAVFTASASAKTYDEMIVFGDSLSDNGNLSTVVPGVLSLLDYDPDRVTSGPTTSPASTFRGVAVEHINDALGLPTLLPAALGGTNYAWAFATTGSDLLDLGNGVTPGTGAQVGAFLATHPVVSADSLFVLWAGSNDLINATTPAEVAMAETIAIANLTTQLSALLGSGAQNVVWFNIPDLSVTPEASLLDSALVDQLHASSVQFRSDWNVALQQLQFAFPTAQITGIDTFGLFDSIRADPAALGLTNVTDPAQGLINANPDEYLFWDSLHPTAKGHAILANYAIAQLQPVPEPSTYGLAAAAALVGLIALRRRSRNNGA